MCCPPVVLVEEGPRTIGTNAWKGCRRLRVVRLPTSVARIEEFAFRGCHALNSVEAPGCVIFGARAFADCCSLQYVVTAQEDNTLVASTQLAPYLFKNCTNLSRITILQDGKDTDRLISAQPRELSQGCFSSSGLHDLKLTLDFDCLGMHACENCKLLAFVDLSSTSIAAIQESTFAHCSKLQNIWLPNMLRAIHAQPLGSGSPTNAFVCCQQSFLGLRAVSAFHPDARGENNVEGALC